MVAVIGAGLVGCSPHADRTVNESISSEQFGSEKSKGMKMTDTQQPRIESELPPSADSVLYMIYGIDGDGATSYPIQNGSIATYWYGYEFELAGKQFFTGFASDTPEKYGKDEEEAYPDPAAQVTLTQATFELAKPGTDKPWSFWGAQRSVGRFGGYERADEIDKDRQAISHVTEDRALALAVPTRRFESGVVTAGYAMFSFKPVKSDVEEVKPWRYLGTVETGMDNADACDDGTVIACVASTGVLSFISRGSALPDVEVTRKGKEISTGGVVNEIPAGSKLRYRFDPATNGYGIE